MRLDPVYFANTQFITDKWVAAARVWVHQCHARGSQVPLHNGAPGLQRGTPRVELQGGRPAEHEHVRGLRCGTHLRSS